MLTLATMECHLPLSSVGRTTSAAVRTAPYHIHNSIHVLQSLSSSSSSPLYESQQHTLLPSMNPSNTLFSNPSALIAWPRYPSCLLLMVVISTLSIPAIPKTSSFVLLDVHGILNILLMNHISAASSLLLITPLMFQDSQPYNSVDHT